MHLKIAKPAFISVNTRLRSYQQDLKIGQDDNNIFFLWVIFNLITFPIQSLRGPENVQLDI